MARFTANIQSASEICVCCVLCYHAVTRAVFVHQYKIHMYVCIYICMPIHVYLYAYVYAHVHVYMYIEGTSVCAPYTRTDTYIIVFICVCVCRQSSHPPCMNKGFCSKASYTYMHDTYTHMHRDTYKCDMCMIFKRSTHVRRPRAVAIA